MSVLCVWAWCHWESKEGVRSPVTGITDGCELPCECWEQNLDPPQEHPMLLTPQPSLQPLQKLFYSIIFSFLRHNNIWNILVLLFRFMCSIVLFLFLHSLRLLYYAQKMLKNISLKLEAETLLCLQTYVLYTIVLLEVQV